MTTTINGTQVNIGQASNKVPSMYGFGAPYQASEFSLAPYVTTANIVTNDNLHVFAPSDLTPMAVAISNLSPRIDSNNPPLWLGITGGNANDTLSITSTLQMANSYDYSAVVIDGGAGDDKLTVNLAEGRISRLTGGDGNDTYNINLNTAGHNMSSAKATVVEAVDYTGNDTYNVSMTGKSEVNIVDRVGNNNVTITNASAPLSMNNDGFRVELGDGTDIVRLNNVSGGGADYQGNWVSTGNGNDTIYVNSSLANSTGDIVLDGGNGADTLSFANAGAQVHIEHGGLSFIKGTSEVQFADVGFETINGSAFDDEFFNKANDNITVNLGNGNDYAYGGTASDVLNGGAGNDNLNGMDGNDTLNGGAGNDVMDGGLGSDVYYVDSAQDVILEGVGLVGDVDTVNLSSTVTAFKISDATNIAPGYVAGIENVNASTASTTIESISSAANRLTGNAGNDTLTDNGGGNDVLNGGAGADYMAGGVGNDTYYVDSTDDIVKEDTGAGTDTVYLTSNLNGYQFNLATNVENAVASNSGNIIVGNALANSIYGGAGEDALSGGAGADTFRTTQGGAWTTVNGVSVYNSGLSGDTIKDFQTGVDKINLANFDASLAGSGQQHFTFIGTAQFTGEGQLRYSDGHLYGNTGGDNTPDLDIKIIGSSTVAATDLVL